MTAPMRVSARPVAGGKLTEEAVHEWQSQGMTLVPPGLLPADRIESLIESAKSVFPEAGSEAARSVRDFGSGGRFVFPSADAVQRANPGPRACRGGGATARCVAFGASLNAV